MSNVKKVVTTRPTETVSGIGGATLVYGFLTQAGVSPVVSALVGVAVGFVPAIVTSVADEIRSTR
jgi:hypothetical protein